MLIFGKKRDFLKSPLISSVYDQRPVQKVDGPIIFKSCRDLEKITGRKIPIKKTYFNTVLRIFLARFHFKHLKKSTRAIKWCINSHIRKEKIIFSIFTKRPFIEGLIFYIQVQVFKVELCQNIQLFYEFFTQKYSGTSQVDLMT